MFGFRWFKKYKIVRIETEVVQVEDEIIQIEEKEPIVYLPRNKLFIAGEEWRYEKGFKYSYSYEGPKVWRLRTFEDVSKHEYSKPIEVLDDEYLFIYKKELIE